MLILWVKAAHIFAVIAWMAALLYLPRLFVYHSTVETGSDQSETFKTMEQRLLRVIATPSMIATWVLGIWLASLFGVWSDGWFLVKFVCVVAMFAFHMMCAANVRKFRNDENTKSEKYFRIFNEAPAVLLVIIIILVVVKPF